MTGAASNSTGRGGLSLSHRLSFSLSLGLLCTSVRWQAAASRDLWMDSLNQSTFPVKCSSSSSSSSVHFSLFHTGMRLSLCSFCPVSCCFLLSFFLSLSPRGEECSVSKDIYTSHSRSFSFSLFFSLTASVPSDRNEWRSLPLSISLFSETLLANNKSDKVLSVPIAISWLCTQFHVNCNSESWPFLLVSCCSPVVRSVLGSLFASLFYDASFSLNCYLYNNLLRRGKKGPKEASGGRWSAPSSLSCMSRLSLSLSLIKSTEKVSWFTCKFSERCVIVSSSQLYPLSDFFLAMRSNCILNSHPTFETGDCYPHAGLFLSSLSLSLSSLLIDGKTRRLRKRWKS